jgi:hypothetical protein
MDAEVLNRAFREFLLPSAPTETPLAALRASGNEKMRVRQLMPVFLKNPAFFHFLMKLNLLAQKVKDWRGEVPETVDHSAVIVDRILSLMGKDLIRNFTVGMALFRGLGSNLPRSNKDAGLNLNPPDVLPLAIAAQDYCMDKKLMHADMAYNAGLIYDWLNVHLTRIKASQDQKAYIKDAFTEGMLTAKIAYRVGQRLGRVEQDRYIFAGALAIPAGKVLMNVLFPKENKEKSWAQFVADCEKHPHGKREAMLAFESKRFPLTHADLASLMASFTEMLRPAEKAILFYNTPYYLNGTNRGLATLSSLWSLAALAVAQPDGKFRVEPHQEKFLKKYYLSTELLKKVLDEAKAEKG